MSVVNWAKTIRSPCRLYTNLDGFEENAFTGEDVNGYEQSGFRGNCVISHLKSWMSM